MLSTEQGIDIQTQNIDLINLERQAIHTTAQIQPDGVVLVLQEPELKILQTTTNTYSVFGMSVLLLQ
ncbi:hypothetical protein [Myxosarcina sp. GI1(2024)]